MCCRRSPGSIVLSLSMICLLGNRALFADQQPALTQPQLDELVVLYKQLHAAPELSFQEEKTAARLAAELKQVGCEVSTQVGRHGVVGLLKNGAGPVVMVRTDLDALPVTEATGLPYASQMKGVDPQGREVGVMHACGHDVHMTCLIGTARWLASHKEAWRGTVMLIGQPAEEIGAGALAMLKDGLFTRFPKPDFGLALHVDSHLVAGKLGFRAGYILANVDSVDIAMRGRGGHGAFPHTTIDPIVQAARLVLDLQTIVSRENPPFEPAVITVGSIHAGTKHNIIPDICRLQLTVRSYGDAARARLLEAIQRKAKAVAASAGAPEPTIEFSDATPATRNDETLVERLVPVFREALGNENVVPSEPSLGGEDFSQYGLAGVPIFMFRIGTVPAERVAELARAGKTLPPLHSPDFYPDPASSIRTGVIGMTAAVLNLLPPKN
ncbi:MAG: amidohydrolase [Planctomycetaceae bacterium]